MKFVCSLLLVPMTAQAVGAAGESDLSWRSVDCGAAMPLTGGNFVLSATLGQPDAGVMNGGDFELVGGFWAVAASATAGPGDCDADGDVDLDDYAAFSGCMSGPGGGLPSPECQCFDFDGGGSIDLADFAEFHVLHPAGRKEMNRG